MEGKDEKLVVNELLFYIQNKIHATPKDAIVESCVKFYTIDEITTAISVFESALKIRLSKRNKSDDLQNNYLNHGCVHSTFTRYLAFCKSQVELNGQNLF